MQLYVIVPDLLVAWIYLTGFIALAVLSQSFEALANSVFHKIQQ